MKSLLIFTAVLFCQTSYAKKIVINQKDKAFDKTKVEAKLGDVLEFKNNDPFQHNVFSFSEGNVFDLQTQDPGKSTPITLDPKKFKGGKMKVECAIHPEMVLEVNITK